MKILILSPYIYNDKYGHSKNKTGFGLMVMGIVDSLFGLGNEVLVLTHALCPKRTEGLRVILKHTFTGVLLHAQMRGLSAYISELCKLRCPLRTKLRLLYYYLDKGFLKYTIKRIRPDIVHIHGLGLGTKNYIDACEELNVPFVVTAHGLIQNVKGASRESKKFEREFFLDSGKKDIPVTVVSSGIKRRLMEDFNCIESGSNIHVVTNGTDLRIMEKKVDIRERYGIAEENKICLAVGSVCERKNQIQIVRAFAILPEHLRESTRLLLIGEISEESQIKKEISRLRLEHLVTCCGFVNSEELPSYYAAADLNILASKDEGFGLSIVEGFVYGVPCVTFSDLDAVSDIYDENAVELCFSRTDESFAQVISAALQKKWDKDAIKRHSQRFLLQAMAEKYMDVYSQTINDFNN